MINKWNKWINITPEKSFIVTKFTLLLKILHFYSRCTIINCWQLSASKLYSLIIPLPKLFHVSSSLFFLLLLDLQYFVSKFDWFNLYKHHKIDYFYSLFKFVGFSWLFPSIDISIYSIQLKQLSYFIKYFQSIF